MHDLEKVKNIISENKRDWLFEGFEIFECDYYHQGDYYFFSIWYDDTNYPPNGGIGYMMFQSRFTHDVEDDDQYVGDSVCFYDDNTILLRGYREDKGSVEYKFSRK